MLLLRATVQKLFSSSICGGIGVNNSQIRTKVRYHLPHPTEVKRVRKQGFLKKVKTVNGRRYLMERILRGDKVIAQ